MPGSGFDRRTAAQCALSVAGFAAFHSLLATERAKRTARALLGRRRADGVYRLGYNGVALASAGLVVRAVWRLPDRPLYRVGGWARGALLAGQALCVAGFLACVRQVGLGRFSGITSLRDLLAGDPHAAAEVRPPPVAQHPPPAPDGELHWGGPYRRSRHPTNYLMLLGWWCLPTMTAKRATIGLVGGAYIVLGSLHEERLLRAAYGERYEAYRRRAPHAFIRPRRGGRAGGGDPNRARCAGFGTRSIGRRRIATRGDPSLRSG